ncbi:hypothetical protein [Cryobacterium algoritolerans]|uniref:hypothetical protein n=1 Tax=Cryobacterium algoritolerans TaxID=1259184 RepID=UPI001F5406BC|nr:hypothetical protein [Cryobacterium algoritolerans]
MTKINELETITDDVIEAAASIFGIENFRHRAITERRHIAPKVTVRGVPQAWLSHVPRQTLGLMTRGKRIEFNAGLRAQSGSTGAKWFTRSSLALGNH